MHVIAARTVRDFAGKNADARNPLMEWLATVEKAEWENLDDFRRFYPGTDAVKVRSGNDVYVFNIKGNTYRLIAAIHFNRGKVYILRFMTHAEYSNNAWKDRL